MPVVNLKTILISCLFIETCYFLSCDALISNGRQSRQRNRRLASELWAALPSPEESAKALSDYMAKSHEEKLKLIKALEDKKNDEIKTLRNELELIKSKSSVSVSTDTNMVSVEELTKKLAAYQLFMSQYVVRASEEKVKAVKEAETAITKRYEDKLNAFLLTAASQPKQTSIIVTDFSRTSDNPLYRDRNLKLVAAANEGKSRWGDMEIRRVQSTLTAFLPLTQTLSNSVESSVKPSSGIASTTENPLYRDRNSKLAAAANAGKSRWGDMEIRRVQSTGTSSLTSAQTLSKPVESSVKPSSGVAPATVGENFVPPVEVIAADKGLRKEGAVGGMTLAERVAFGAKTNSGSQSTASVSLPIEVSLYSKRNIRILSASTAGKQSRWGSKEEARAVTLAASLPKGTINIESSNQNASKSTTVDFPKLIDRVNLGAKLLFAI